MTEVSGLGVVIAGGEGARQVGPPQLLSTVEVYFTSGEHAGELRELAWSLSRPRSGHQAYLVERDGRRFLFLVGGQTPVEPAVGDPRSGTEVEVFPLP